MDAVGLLTMRTDSVVVQVAAVERIVECIEIARATVRFASVHTA